jgi:2,3,4,5-tetrahydropyridine-2-carboxylate N-succinyltransferase
VKRAILLYFAVRAMEKVELGPFEFHDKIPLKTRLDGAGRPRRAPGHRRATAPSWSRAAS